MTFVTESEVARHHGIGGHRLVCVLCHDWWPCVIVRRWREQEGTAS